MTLVRYHAEQTIHLTEIAPPLNQRPAATRTGTGSAAEAMVAGENLAVLDLGRVDLPQIQALVAPATAGPLHLQHLIEIAVEDFPLPTDVDHVAAHEAVNCAGIKGVI